jgi:uncharacterized protein involved in outer membrane biogenesis
MKTLVRMLGGVAVLVVAVAVAGVAVLKSMDFDTYRGLIAERVKEATGRELVIAGPLKLEISLTPALAVERVTFANAPWGSRKDMLVLKRLAAEVRLMPLLRGEVRVNRLVLEGLDVLLEVDGQGRANWAIAPAAPAAPGPGPDQRVLPVFNRVDARDVRLAYRDARDGTAFDLAVNAAFMEGKNAESPIDAILKLNYNGRPVSATARLGSLKELAEENARYPVRLAVESTGLKASLDGQVVNPRAPKEMDFKTTIAGDSLAALLPPAQAARAPAIGPLKAAFRIKGKGREYALEGIEASAGQSDFAGSARVSLAARVPEVSASFRSRRLDLKELFPGAKTSDPSPAQNGRVFPNDPLPLEALQSVNGDLDYKLEKVVFPGGITLREVDAKAKLRDGRLALPVALTAAGGRVKGEANIDGSRPPARIALRLDGDNVDWGRLLADAGKAEAVWDSKAEAAIDVRGAGNSVRALMASLEGDAKVVLGPGRIGNKYLDLAGADALTEVLTAFNPFAKSDEFSMLKCAVARFKVMDGVAESRDGLALETGKMNVAGGGRVDLGAETLDLAFKPEARQGLGVGLGNLVGQVRVQGTFAKPSYALDPLAAVTGTVGAVTGAVTGGISAITGALTGDRAKPETAPCQVALGLRPQPQVTPPRSETRPALAPPERKNEGIGGAVRGIGEGIGRSLKDILGR